MKGAAGELPQAWGAWLDRTVAPGAGGSGLERKAGPRVAAGIAPDECGDALGEAAGGTGLERTGATLVGAACTEGRLEPSNGCGPLGGNGLAREGITLGEGGAGGMGLGGLVLGGRLSSTTGRGGRGIVSSSPTSVSSSTSVWNGSLFTTGRGKGSSIETGSDAAIG